MSKLIFVSNKLEISAQAVKIFNDEALKMSVMWTAATASPADLASTGGDADMVIALQADGWAVEIPRSLKCEAETWAGDEGAIRQNVSRLLVKLIMRGGKRQPTVQSSFPGKTTTGTVSAAKSNSLANLKVRVFLESKGRAGKKVTVVSGLELDEKQLEDMATRLKRSCGTGGTSKDGAIEIQGDQRDKLMTELEKLGYKPKRAGG